MFDRLALVQSLVDLMIKGLGITVQELIADPKSLERILPVEQSAIVERPKMALAVVPTERRTTENHDRLFFEFVQLLEIVPHHHDALHEKS